VKPDIHPFFLPSSHGGLYALYFPQIAAEARGTLLWLLPFAEEANCARRHIVAAAHECRALGYASLIVDPFGTGESEGDLSDATWDIWRSNVIDAANWLREREPAPLWLAGVRAGALLAASVVPDVSPAGMVCWQPVSSGRAVLDGFLRMKLASEWAVAESANAADILGRLRDQLATGASVEVAGYVLPAALAQSVEAQTLAWPSDVCARAACLEFRARHEDAARVHSPAFERLSESLREQSVQLASAVVETPPFWMLYEVPLTPGLGEKTLSLIGALKP
jgi:exosortase A-associated hydrolase 2